MCESPCTLHPGSVSISRVQWCDLNSNRSPYHLCLQACISCSVLLECLMKNLPESPITINMSQTLEYTRLLLVRLIHILLNWMFGLRLKYKMSLVQGETVLVSHLMFRCECCALLKRHIA